MIPLNTSMPELRVGMFFTGRIAGVSPAFSRYTSTEIAPLPAATIDPATTITSTTIVLGFGPGSIEGGTVRHSDELCESECLAVGNL
ncbi:MAG: hypothetical protein ACTSX7_10280 [Alphaproteobacteria bacterium]